MNRILGKNREKRVSGRRRHIFLFTQLKTVCSPGLHSATRLTHTGNRHSAAAQLWTSALLFSSGFRTSSVKAVLPHLRAWMLCQRKRKHKTCWKSAKWLERGLMLCKCKKLISKHLAAKCLM